jgi:methionine-rich copper-binding protein CopC
MRPGQPFAVLCLLLPSTAVLAHANLVSSNPAADTVVVAPKSIKLTFTEKIDAASSGIRLSMGDGMGVSTAAASVSADGMTLIARTTSPFMAGKWTLSRHALSADDGHGTQGSYSFTVK